MSNVEYSLSNINYFHYSLLILYAYAFLSVKPVIPYWIWLSTLQLHSASPTCSSSEYICASGGCISASLKCNGEYDCADGSDEVKTYHLIEVFELHELDLEKQM